MNLLRSRRFRAVVLDPTAVTEEAIEYVALQASETAQRLLLLAPTTSLAARRILAASRHTPVHVVLVDSESTDRLLTIELQRLDVGSARAPLLSVVNDAVGMFPPSMCAAAVSLFGVLPLPESSLEFARRVGCSRRTLDRWARRAGFRGAASLLRSVRLAWAWEMSKDEGRDTWKGVSAECGYGSARTLRAHSRRLLGLAPGKLAQTSFEGALVERLAHTAIGPPRRSARAVLKETDR